MRTHIMRPGILLACCLIVCFTLLISNAISQEPEAVTKDQIAERDRLWENAMELTKAGKLDEAAMLFEQYYSFERPASGPAHAELIKILDSLAQLAALKQDHQSIIALRKRQHLITKQYHGESSYQTKMPSEQSPKPRKTQPVPPTTTLAFNKRKSSTKTSSNCTEKDNTPLPTISQSKWPRFEKSCSARSILTTRPA